jgi:hypothetical protein
VKRTGREVAVTLQARVDADPERVFDFVAAEGVLPEVLTGYTRFLPAVVGTSGNTGPWDTPGSSRTVHLKDGSTAREEVTGYDRPAYFAYQRLHLRAPPHRRGRDRPVVVHARGPGHPGAVDLHLQGQGLAPRPGADGLRPPALVRVHGGVPGQHAAPLPSRRSAVTPNQALHLTRPAMAAPGVHSSLTRAGQVSLGVESVGKVPKQIFV